MTRTLLLLAFTAMVEAAVPRPELPQPLFHRPAWQTLNGEWEFEFDDANRGLAEGWAQRTQAFSRRIQVPYAFETKLSGIGDTGFHRWVWYRRAIAVPPDWAGRRVLLKFGAVDYRATVWVNGQLMGSHEGGSVPFWFDITKALQKTNNVVTVRVDDPPEDRTIPRGKQYWREKSQSIFYTRTTGIWQPVWLEAAGEAFLERVRIKTQLDGQVRFEARVVNAKPTLQLAAVIKNGDREVARVESTGVLGEGLTAAARIAEPRLWSVGSPNLYDVTFLLRDGGKTMDEVHSYFGFREVTIESGRMFLNGSPLYLKMVLDQGYWPESTLTPPTDDAIRKDIELTKAMGFNGARKHQKLEDPRFLYWADKMGFLVSSEAANAYVYDEEYAARFTREWMESVERDVNHPSIVMWIPINESWGVSTPREPRQQHHLKALYHLTKSLDPTRPVIDNDGWEHTDTTDLFGIHDYTAYGDALFRKYERAGEPGQPFPANGRAAVLPGYAYNGSPIFLSEFGGVAYHKEGSPRPEGSWGYAGVEPTAELAFARMATLWDAIARLPRIMGICYTQLTDVEQEINGLLTYDRQPKFDLKRIKELNDRLR
jgi:beta-galactosidase/beta-glucuronidase